MFLAVKNDTGAVQPWEYLPASTGEYKVGQLLAIDGELTPLGGVCATTPPYLCMTEVTVPEGEVQVIPVVRVTGDTIFEVENSGAQLPPGTKVAVGADGLTITTAQEGTFEIVDNPDGAVRGRFV